MLLTVLGWSVVLAAVGETAAAAAVVPTLVLSAEQVVTALTGTTQGRGAHEVMREVTREGARDAAQDVAHDVSNDVAHDEERVG
ncbi:hypothetical protein Sipo8835_27150 [Streptomyces ipomoeae]|uniref:Uncharacterized protein n=1 Tax=Streptomyces ipomoeae TaxID=103232 RepID=A0AAE9AY48_9ACTN|nr:hypothetical protein [Streptomyces ipomoeae]MDX2700355.1 hypothetical protein [Streptomyces ipomoeae]MDX2827930.1 hypothetical protein [Streptomyces ipomoeae]MDX2846011.1 hypothetical protein [Streptomyces ipomoeae]MDX2880530.1 hypothetical protein [Streptomyces ipomoeae]TQE27498.1 hypothetical protein Sipo8835_27150 [Streptomyces ipomoeae]